MKIPHNRAGSRVALIASGSVFALPAFSAEKTVMVGGRGDVSVQEHHRERGQLEGPHHAGGGR